MALRSVEQTLYTTCPFFRSLVIGRRVIIASRVALNKPDDRATMEIVFLADNENGGDDDAMSNKATAITAAQEEQRQLRVAERLADRRVAELRRAKPMSELDEARIDWSAIERRAALHRDRERERLTRINRLLDRAHDLRTAARGADWKQR